MFDKRSEVARFIAVAEAGSLGEAAERLGITQPALGRLITRLERRLRARLFERTPAGMRLTPVGAATLAPARRLLGEFVAAERTLDTIRAGREAVFRVTANPVLAEALLPAAAARFHAAFPGIELTVETTTRAEGLRRLADGRSDLHLGGVDAEEALPAWLRRERFLDVTAGIVAARAHPLAAREVTDDDLARCAWVDFDAADAPGDGRPSLGALFERLYQSTHRRVRTVVRTGPPGLFLLAAGAYLAWLPVTFLERLPGRLLRPLAVTRGRFEYRSGFVVRRAAEDLAPFRRFEAIVRETALGRRG